MKQLQKIYETSTEKSDERLNENIKILFQRIRPVMRFVEIRYKNKKEYEPDPRGDLYFISAGNERCNAFSWDTKPAEKANKIQKMGEIETYHDCRDDEFFQPLIADVISQIPAKYLQEVTAFETSMADVKLDGERHKTKTILYKNKLNKK